MRTFICSLSLVALCCLVSGCSGGGKQLNGKIVQGGQPFALSDKGVFVMSLQNTDTKDKSTYNATTKPDGTFTILGPENKGIPPGKYKVHLEAMDPYPATDKLGGKYAPGKSQLIVEVGKTDLTIDVGK